MIAAMLRPATPADRPDLVALILAEDAAWTDAAPVSAEETGELVDDEVPGVVYERDGRACGYAALGEGGDTTLAIDPTIDPGPVLEAITGWLGERGQQEIYTYAGDA